MDAEPAGDLRDHLIDFSCFICHAGLKGHVARLPSYSKAYNARAKDIASLDAP